LFDLFILSWLRLPCLRLIITAPVNTFTGYGQLFVELFARLHSRGHEVLVNPLEIKTKWGDVACPIPGIIKEALIPPKERKEFRCAAELVIPPQGWRQLPNTKSQSVCFTMYESTAVNPAQVMILNRYRSVIVPCEMNQDALLSSGVTVPVRTVPLGIEPDIFGGPLATRVENVCHRGVPKPRPLTFATSGLMAHSRHRKNVELSIQAFHNAFPGIEDVRLEIKCFPNDPIPECSDPRIVIIRELWPTHKLVNWYDSIDVFMVTSRGEGWGLMPHQAMARGVPVIGPMFGGLAEFLTVKASYIVFARLQPSANENGGVEAIVDLGSMVEQMRRIYFDRPELRQKRLRSKHRAEQFTWDRTVTEVEAVLEEASLITEVIF